MVEVVEVEPVKASALDLPPVLAALPAHKRIDLAAWDADLELDGLDVIAKGQPKVAERQRVFELVAWVPRADVDRRVAVQPPQSSFVDQPSKMVLRQPLRGLQAGEYRRLDVLPRDGAEAVDQRQDLRLTLWSQGDRHRGPSFRRRPATARAPARSAPTSTARRRPRAAAAGVRRRRSRAGCGC